MGDEFTIISNDAVYFCESCENVLRVYSTLAETRYCPCCGEEIDRTDIFYGKIMEVSED